MNQTPGYDMGAQSSDAPADEHALVCVKHVTRQFNMGTETVTALNDITLAVGRNEFLGLSGPSGSGKSTLLYLISGMDRPTHGEIWVNRVNIAGMSRTQLAAYRRTEIGFVFQSFNLISGMTALENVMLPMIFAGTAHHVRQERARYLLGRVGLSQRMHHRPSQMSGGQQQRVAIARALANNPALLCADEPTGNLDSRAGEDVMNLLHELHFDGHTVLLVSHDAAVVSQCKRVVHLRNGQMSQ